MEQSIKIKIAEYEYPLKVTSSQQEEDIRKAAQEINRQIQAYQSRYTDKTLVEVLSIMALNVCVNNISLNRQVKGMKDAEESLARELDGYLDNIDKNSRQLLIFAEININNVTGRTRLGKTGLCDPYGDSAMRDGGFLNLMTGAQILFIKIF